MQRQDLIDVNIQAPNIGLESNRERIRNFGWLRARRAWSKGIGFDQNFFLAQIGHDDPIMMGVTADLIELHRARAVGQNHIVAHGLENWLLSRSR